MIVFDGEFINAETQETQPIAGMPLAEVIRLLRRMSDGDALVANARQERGDWS